MAAFIAFQVEQASTRPILSQASRRGSQEGPRGVGPSTEIPWGPIGEAPELEPRDQELTAGAGVLIPGHRDALNPARGWTASFVELPWALPYGEQPWPSIPALEGMRTALRLHLLPGRSTRSLRVNMALWPQVLSQPPPRPPPLPPLPHGQRAWER